MRFEGFTSPHRCVSGPGFLPHWAVIFAKLSGTNPGVARPAQLGGRRLAGGDEGTGRRSRIAGCGRL